MRVRVRFAGRLVDGVLLERTEASEHPGSLAWVERVVSPEPVLSPEVAALCRRVADRYAGTFADVLRLAVPPRHARTEAEPPRPAALPPERPAAAGWDRYQRGSALLDALAGGRVAHAAWQALPDEDWAARLAEAAACTASAGRGAVLVVADNRDARRLLAACEALLGAGGVELLTAETGPAERYRRWLAVRRGAVRVVVGTRSAAFAPIAEPGLLAIWDDGDDLHAEPRAPYPHVREVLTARAHDAGAGLLIGGYARTAEAQLLVESGWAYDVVAPRPAVRAAAPRVAAVGSDERQLARDPGARAARLPSMAFEAARSALQDGRGVLVQVPRTGYVPALNCANCREPARCRHCAGPLLIPERSSAEPARALRCGWCGRVASAFRCTACGAGRVRATVVGAVRTAEELGRAFPGVAVRSSGAGSPVLDAVPGGPALVVATPGAEPPAEGGYGAALLLDGWVLLSRPDLRVAEETLRRWFAAAALVVPHGEGGRVVVVAESDAAPVQALLRWDPTGHAAAELAARTEVGFPPAVHMAAVDGAPAAVAELLAGAELPPSAQVLGPVELAGGRERALVRVPRLDGRALAAALAAAHAGRTARKATDPVRIQVDPAGLG